MSTTITAAQRAVLYEEIISKFQSGLGEELWVAIRTGNWSKADQLGWEVSDLLRFVSEDLRWGNNSHCSVLKLTAPSDLIGRVSQYLSEGRRVLPSRVEGQSEATVRFHLSGEERDALVASVLDRVSGIDGIRLLIRDGKWTRLERFALEYSDLIRLGCSGAGWRSDAGEAVVVNAPRTVLRRVVPAIERMALGAADRFRQEYEEALAELAGEEALLAACARLSDQLSREGDAPSE